MTGETWTVIAVGVSVIGVTLGSHAVLWRAVAALGVRVDALGVQLADVDRRLARLEGWIEGERVGRSRLADPGDTAGAS